MLVRTKPVIVEAFKWTGDVDQEEDPVWIIEAIKLETVWINRCPLIMHIETPKGVMDARPGDYIIKNCKGELYPCNSYTFEKTYEDGDKDKDKIIEQLKREILELREVVSRG